MGPSRWWARHSVDNLFGIILSFGGASAAHLFLSCKKGDNQRLLLEFSMMFQEIFRIISVAVNIACIDASRRASCRIKVPPLWEFLAAFFASNVSAVCVFFPRNGLKPLFFAQYDWWRGLKLLNNGLKALDLKLHIHDEVAHQGQFFGVYDAIIKKGRKRGERKGREKERRRKGKREERRTGREVEVNLIDATWPRTSLKQL